MLLVAPLIIILVIIVSLLKPRDDYMIHVMLIKFCGWPRSLLICFLMLVPGDEEKTERDAFDLLIHFIPYFSYSASSGPSPVSLGG